MGCGCSNFLITVTFVPSWSSPAVFLSTAPCHGLTASSCVWLILNIKYCTCETMYTNSLEGVTVSRAKVNSCFCQLSARTGKRGHLSSHLSLMFAEVPGNSVPDSHSDNLSAPLYFQGAVSRGLKLGGGGWVGGWEGRCGRFQSPTLGRLRILTLISNHAKPQAVSWTSQPLLSSWQKLPGQPQPRL